MHAWGIASFRLDDPARRLPMLAAYARPSPPRWTHGWRSDRPRACLRAGLGFEPYAVAPALATWMPALAMDDASEDSTCADISNEAAGVGVEDTGARTIALQLDAGPAEGWTLPRPGTMASWFGSEGSSAPCVRKPVSFLRYGAESDRFPLLGCDGSVDGEALDRLSVMARPVGVARPALPLPEEPVVGAPNGEWVDSIKLVHPRLVWLVQQMATAFPGRTIYIVSGYRRGAHEAAHGDARALDVSVVGVAKERVYKACRQLRDTGCGYYPNHELVHIDVRAPGSGGSYWIDVSRPGERSEYVSTWPGVEEGRSGRWQRAGDR